VHHIGQLPRITKNTVMFKYLKKNTKNYMFHTRALKNTATHVKNQQMQTGKICFVILLKFT
jgi:hypothetical protein